MYCAADAYLILLAVPNLSAWPHAPLNGKPCERAAVGDTASQRPAGRWLQRQSAVSRRAMHLGEAALSLGIGPHHLPFLAQL